jgi:uncharacterized membrane protein YtjA (UPF0391 family)
VALAMARAFPGTRIADANRAIAGESANGGSMIKWAIIFFVISLIAGFFGFTNVAAGARGIAKALFLRCTRDLSDRPHLRRLSRRPGVLTGAP